ncbi:hypothetical protein PC111_g6063 [Phytophthora cactorum]|nr:hypothetical protein PC111_g6063 [Phytophthora cactorum]
MASAGVTVVSSAFLRLGCSSDHALFAPTYTRSNKKRNAKLLRCFPHCCPRHVPRSYCGCSLHLLITFESEEATAMADENSDLFVCARFESTTTTATAGAGDVATAMSPGGTVALPASVITPSVVTTTESDWIRAEKVSSAHQHQAPENTILYVLNNCSRPMWYYSYESGSTQAQRQMKHVLAAYVFVLHPGPSNTSYETNDELTSNGVRLASVVARQESPSFTMVSYRRQNDKSHRGRVVTSPVSEEKAHAFKIEDDQSQPSKFRPPLPPQDHVCQRNYAVRQNDGPSQRSETRIGNGLSDEWIVDSVTVREAESRQLQDKPQPDSTYPARQSQHLCCPVCKVNAADARLHDSNPSLLSVLAFIAILASVDLTIEGSRLSVEAVMSESTPDLHTTSGTVLELDGQTRTFEKLPSGLPAAAASVLFGDSWNFDAYSGYVSDDGGSLEILLTTPSQSQANQRFERPNKYYAGTELTLLARTAQLEKNATTGRLAHNSSVLNWSKVHEINATYVALPLNSSPI